MNGFDITNFGSWEEASGTKQFTWKGTVFPNTEKEVTLFMGKAVGMLREGFSSEKINIIGVSNIATAIIDLLAAGISADNSLLIVGGGIRRNTDFSWPFFKANPPIDTGNKRFNIEDHNTWKFATESELLLDGSPFRISPDCKLSEITFVKLMLLLMPFDFSKFDKIPSLKNKIVLDVLDGLKKGMEPSDILLQITDVVTQILQTVTKNNNAMNAEHSTPPLLTPPSKAGLVFGVVLIATGIFLLISALDGDNVSLGVFGFILMIFSIITFAKYSSEQSKFFYKAVCADMAQWVGRSSNDLIMQWGAPTKTYKFPNDRTMTVLEYKDSIRNYASYSNKGYRYGQSKTTKYVKSFFVKDEIIINYKYTIT
jgi:hypothetical protein